MNKEEIKSIIIENKLDDAVNVLFKATQSLVSKANIAKGDWISVFDNPPPNADVVGMTDGDFLCVNDRGDYLVGSISKTGLNKYTAYQRNGSCLSDVTHYMALPQNPNPKN